MGRRKKKPKQSSDTKKVSAVAQDSQISAVPQNQPPKSAPAAEKRTDKKGSRSGVSVATCLAGMFLTLVLGVYLGTLMPGIMADIQKKPAQVAQAPIMPVQSEEPKMDPALLKMVSELEKKAKANPDSGPDWINLGNIYFDAAQPEKAIAAYEHALALAPANADVLTDLGIMYRETGQFTKAVDCFRKAIEISPRHENAMYNEGVVLSADLRKNDEARLAWQRLLEINPQARAPNGRPLGEMIQQLQ